MNDKPEITETPTPRRFEPSGFPRVSLIISDILLFFFLFGALIYIFLKTLTCPRYLNLDTAIARWLIEYHVTSSWIESIAVSAVNVDLPEVRHDLLWELGAVFEEGL